VRQACVDKDDDVEDFENPTLVGDSDVQAAPSNAKKQGDAPGKEKEAQQKLTAIPRPPPPYP
ncbi:hypothetical protein HAX54_026199, partial [Datura stramonium]|nr:hypothetical protein [Datura stramonium]